MLVARTWARGRLLAREMLALDRRLVEAIAGKSTSDLSANREHGQGASLVDTVFELATVRAVVMPDLVASILCLAIALGLVASRLGWHWLALGGVGWVVLFAVLTPARRAARRVRERGWKAHLRTARSLDALLFAAAELRASERQHVLGASIERDVREVGGAEHRGMLLGSVLTLGPAVIGAVLVLVPRAWVDGLLGSHIAEVGVLVGAGASFSLASMTGLETIARTAPTRGMLDAFLKPGPPEGLIARAARSDALERSTDEAQIRSLELQRVSVAYEGDPRRTPDELSFSLERGGIALLGPNGTGKTTTLLAAIGLVIPSEGVVRLNGTVPSEHEWRALRRRVLFLSQRPYVVPDETLAWHVGLLGTRNAPEAEMEKALERLDIARVLRPRAAARGLPITALPMGELSGGEQRRVLLARALVHDADLVLVDEPEAGLDTGARELVRSVLEELASRRLIVLVAHDTTIVPDTFQRRSLESGADRDAGMLHVAELV